MTITHDPTEPFWLSRRLGDTVFIFDFPAFLHRAMHGCYGKNVRTTPSSDTTCARQAVMMLANVIERLQCKRLMLVVDGIRDTEHDGEAWAMSDLPLLRCDIYSSYKAGRAVQPDVFRVQAPRLYRRLHELPLCVVRKERYEADDLIGTLVQQRDVPLCIVTSDKDMAQYVNEQHVVLYDPTKKDHAFMGVHGCIAKFDVLPTQIPDYVGLVGDPVDNIPGVPGIGPKAAAKLLREFEHLDDLYSDIGQASPLLNKKQFASLCEHRERAFLSRRLAQPIITITALPTPTASQPDHLRPHRVDALPNTLREAARAWYP